MVFINEWLPNPGVGKSEEQFIELYNNGDTAVNLGGWRLEKANGKKFMIGPGSILARGYLILPRAETKLVLKHSDETLSFYDSDGRLVDQSSFHGSAKVGKSFSRANYETGPAQHFAWNFLTPGGENQMTLDTTASENRHPTNAPLNNYSLGALPFFGLMLAAGAILAALVVYSMKLYETIREPLFERDETVW